MSPSVDALSLRFFLVAAIALTLGRDRLGVGEPVSRQRFSYIYLFLSEFAASRPADIPLVALVRLDESAFGRHNFSFGCRPQSRLHVLFQRDVTQDCDFFQAFKSTMVAAATSLTAVRNHLEVSGDSCPSPRGAKMDIRRLPGHGMEQFALILLAAHRLDFYGRGIRCQLANQPLGAQAHEGSGQGIACSRASW
jgi:hypothetical protein